MVFLHAREFHCKWGCPICTWNQLPDAQPIIISHNMLQFQLPIEKWLVPAQSQTTLFHCWITHDELMNSSAFSHKKHLFVSPILNLHSRTIPGLLLFSRAGSGANRGRANLPLSQLCLQIHTVFLLGCKIGFSKGIQCVEAVARSGGGPVFGHGEDHGVCVGGGGAFLAHSGARAVHPILGLLH